MRNVMRFFFWKIPVPGENEFAVQPLSALESRLRVGIDNFVAVVETPAGFENENVVAARLLFYLEEDPVPGIDFPVAFDADQPRDRFLIGLFLGGGNKEAAGFRREDRTPEGKFLIRPFALIGNFMTGREPPTTL